jgi:dTDP-4-dehydrorhamnose 3,5-epimerase
MMRLRPTKIQGVYVAETDVRGDNRGSFARFFCENELAAMLGMRRIVQINHSRTSVLGAIRGLHYQLPPHAEMKFIRCIRGRVWDVAVDLRAQSPTLGQWHAEELTPESARMLVIPEGCAHGFQALVADSELLYLHTACYAPESEGGVVYNDPQLQIPWPLPVAALSMRDRRLPAIPAAFTGICL